MPEQENVADCLKRLAEAVARFEPLSRQSSHRLSPYKELIVSLHGKGASLRVVADVLHSCGIEVSHHTVARFLRRVARSKQETKRATGRKTKRVPSRATMHATSPETERHPSQLPAHATAHERVRATEPAPEPPLSPVSSHAAVPAPPSFPSPRSRGPRIADVRNL